MCPNGNRRMRDNSHFINAIGLYENHTWNNWTLSKVRKSSWWKIEGGWIRSIPRVVTPARAGGWRCDTATFCE